jgi:VWFA-related protein
MRSAIDAIDPKIFGFPLLPSHPQRRTLLHPQNRAPILAAPILAMIMSVIVCAWSAAQGQQASSSAPSFQVTSNLVYLDVTVLDKKGNPVVTGLTKDDFIITEDKQPRPIFSFEPPAPLVLRADEPGQNADEDGSTNAPATILLLDRLNSKFEDYAFLRQSLRKYLTAQPDRLPAPVELMLLDNQSLELIQGYTRNTADLIDALDQVPRALPYKLGAGWALERLAESIEALQQIAMQNKTVPGRKNLVWLGYGGPSYIQLPGDPNNPKDTRFFVHDTTNMLVDSRVTLYLLFPGIKAQNPTNFARTSSLFALHKIGEDDPFTGDINFGLFVNGTGGKLFALNNVDGEISRAQDLGSHCYTLTYRPQGEYSYGQFRRIRVSVRNPDLRVVTKTGYYAPDNESPQDPRRKSMVELSEAAQSTVPFDNLKLSIVRVVRHPDNGTAEITLLLQSSHLDWEDSGPGQSSAPVELGIVSLDRTREILASYRQKFTIYSNTQDGARLAKSATLLTMTVKVPQPTRTLRAVVTSAGSGQLGTAELDRRGLDAAPEQPSPTPGLLRR